MINIDLPSTLLDAWPSVSKSGLSRFLNRARTLVGLPGQVDVLLTSDAELKRLNRYYRGKNEATDVLSFPTPPEVAQHHAGDLAISLDTAARQAATFSHSLEVELKVLLLHGLLHLDGEDHEIDSGEMAARESELRTKLKLPVSLIDRVTNPAKKKPVAAKKVSSLPKPSLPSPKRSFASASNNPSPDKKKRGRP